MNNLNQYLDVNPEVAQALAEGKPVVALESTIISHGMPYPQNVETALKVEEIIRSNGAVPATIAILGGRLKAGLTKDEIEYLGKQGQAVTKASRRDLAVLVAKGADGATTVTIQYARAVRHCHLLRVKGLHLNIPNDLFNGYRRDYAGDGGRWLCVDGRLGVASVYGDRKSVV